MSRWVLLLVAALASASVSAQSHKVEFIDGGSLWEYQVHNASDVALDAFVIGITCDVHNTVGGENITKPGSAAVGDISQTVSEDILSYPQGRFKEMQPGETRGFRSVATGGVDSYNCHEHLKGAIFADGFVVNPSGLHPVYEGRRGTYEELQFIYPLLQKIAAGTVSADSAEAALTARRSKLSRSPVFVDERYAARLNVILNFILALQRRSIVHFEGEDRSQPEPRVSEFAADNKLSLEQAHATLLAGKVQEWMNTLQPNLSPNTRKH